MCLICWITISCKKTRHHDGPGDQEVGGHHQDAEQQVYQVKDGGDDLKTGVIKGVKILMNRAYSWEYLFPGLAQAVEPKVVEMAANKLSDGYEKYKNKKKKKKEEEKPDEDDGNKAKDDNETNL